MPGAVLPGSEGSAHGGVGGRVSSTIFHQYPAAVAIGAPLPLSCAQRRDQHRTGQSQLGRGARTPVSFTGVARPERSAARGVVDRLGFAVPRQHARTAAGGRTRSHACAAHVDTACVAIGGHDRSRPEGILRVLRHPHGAVGRPRRHRNGRRTVCLLHAGPKRVASRALGHHQEPPHHHRIRGRRLGLSSRGRGAQGQVGARRDPGPRPADRRVDGHQAGG